MNPQPHTTEPRPPDSPAIAPLGADAPVIDVAAASITVLRLGQSAPPELIWRPTKRCAWRMWIGVGSGLFSSPGCSTGATTPIEWGIHDWGTCQSAAGITVSIEHPDSELANRFVETHGRGLRIMAWTEQELPGRRRPAEGRWTRITVDELVHEFTGRRSQGWMSVLSSQAVGPITDFAAPPTTS